MKVLELILEERKHQKALGYDAEHDDTHTNNEISLAASCYLLKCSHPGITTEIQNNLNWEIYPSNWDYKSNLVKGIALAIAELERVIRSEKDGV